MKYFLGVLALVAIAGGIFYSFWMPLPDAPARDAIGEEKFVTRNDRKIAYYVSGQGEPVVLFASAGREASDFNELAQALNSAGYQTITIEAPGINGSDMLHEPAGLMYLSDDMTAVVLREFGNDKSLFVIGHAYGNRLARAFTYYNDERLKGVILIAAGGAWAVPEKANVALKAIFDPRRTVSQRKEDINQAFFAKGNTIPRHWLVGWHRQTAILQGNAMGRNSYSMWGAGGTKPMLVIQGAEDAIAPIEDAGAPLAAKFPDRVQLVTIDNAGHALLPEQPDQIAGAIIAFLQEQQ